MTKKTITTPVAAAVAMTLDEFNKTFAADLATITESERITRTTLRDMSRYMLHVLHNVDCDVRAVNQLLGVLTPKNREATILYFKELSGFNFDKEKLFTTKDKKNYEEIRNKAMSFLEDVHNNIWTWAAANLKESELISKPFDPKEVEKMVAKQLKKAVKDNVEDAQAQILLAVLEGGINSDVLLQVLNKLEASKAEAAAA